MMDIRKWSRRRQVLVGAACLAVVGVAVPASMAAFGLVAYSTHTVASGHAIKAPSSTHSAEPVAADTAAPTPTPTAAATTAAGAPATSGGSTSSSSGGKKTSGGSKAAPAPVPAPAPPAPAPAPAPPAPPPPPFTPSKTQVDNAVQAATGALPVDGTPVAGKSVAGYSCGQLNSGGNSVEASNVYDGLGPAGTGGGVLAYKAWGSAGRLNVIYYTCFPPPPPPS